MNTIKKLFLSATLLIATTPAWPVAKNIDLMLQLQINFAQQAFNQQCQLLFADMKTGNIPKINETITHLKNLMADSMQILKTLSPEQQKIVVTQFLTFTYNGLKQSIDEFIMHNTIPAKTKNEVIQLLTHYMQEFLALDATSKLLQELDLLNTQTITQLIDHVLKAVPAGIQYESIEPLFTLIFSSPQHKPTVEMLKTIITNYTRENITEQQQTLLMQIATLLLDLGAQPDDNIINYARESGLTQLADLLNTYK